jgi:hypothetical protein
LTIDAITTAVHDAVNKPAKVSEHSPPERLNISGGGRNSVNPEISWFTIDPWDLWMARLPITKTSLASSVWAEPPTANPDIYADELQDAYLLVEADALHAEYAANGVEFTRELANMPWHSREFVVKDCGGRLLAFGSNL